MIISEIPFVVNYGSDGSKTTILTQLADWKKSLGEVTSDTRKFVEEFKRIGSDNANIDELIQKFSGVDKAVAEAAEKIKYGDEKISAIDTAMQNAATKGSQFATTLTNIAANALPILAISAAIQLVQAGWDALNVTVEEQEAKVSSLQAAYQNLSSEYEQLSGKQDPTDAEKNRLSYLERRLELDERILKAEKSQLFDEKTGDKFTDLFDPENMETQYKKEMAGSGSEWNFLSGFAQNRDGYAYLSGLYERKMEDIQASQQQIEEWTKYRDAVEEGSDAWNIYQSNIDSAQNRQTDAIDTLSEKEDQLVINLGKYADNMEYLEEQLASDNLTDSQTKTAQEQLAKWKSLYENTQLMIDTIQKLNGTYEDPLTALQQIDDKYGGGRSDAPSSDSGRTQEEKNFRKFSHYLNSDDQQIVNSEAFKQALDQIREKLDGAELSQSVALTAGADSVMQDPAAVADLWNAVESRIYGTRQELEAAGAETAGMLESTTQLRDLVQGLTGFDIMADSAGTQLKALYSIIVGIGQEWSALSASEQGGLLDALAGSQGDALGSVLNNVSAIETAYQSAGNASGSALAAQEEYEQGIQYSLDRLKASFQQFADTLAGDGLLKGIVDFGNGTVNVLDSITGFLGPLASAELTGAGLGITKFIKNLDCRKVLKIA